MVGNGSSIFLVGAKGFKRRRPYKNGGTPFSRIRVVCTSLFERKTTQKQLLNFEQKNQCQSYFKAHLKVSWRSLFGFFPCACWLFNISCSLCVFLFNLHSGCFRLLQPGFWTMGASWWFDNMCRRTRNVLIQMSYLHHESCCLKWSTFRSVLY